MNGEGYTFLPALFSTDMFPYWRINHTKDYVRCDRGFRWNPSATIYNLHTEEDSESHGKGTCYLKYANFTAHFDKHGIGDLCFFLLLVACTQ